MKSLYDISWQVDEPTYRADPALSYSTLARFEREGFDNLSHLFDHIDTPSLLLGSLVDCLITGSREEFASLYYVADFPSLGEKERQIAKALYQQFGNACPNFDSLPYDSILSTANALSFQNNWRDDTRVRVLKERCGTYYHLLKQAEEKRVVDTKTYDTACAMVRALKDSPATSGFFADNQLGSPMQRYYQLKFKREFGGIAYRCMMDLALVDYEDKRIIPCDLKTSGHPEWHFEESFVQWQYPVQARLYWRVLRETMDEDDYFKDFTLDDYRFIVVNRNTLTPLVWRFPLTKSYGTLADGKGNQYRDPFEIGNELYGYLYDKPRVPNGIDAYGENEIKCLKMKEEASIGEQERQTSCANPNDIEGD